MFLSLQGTEIKAIDITEALGATQETRKTKSVSKAHYESFRSFFG